MRFSSRIAQINQSNKIQSQNTSNPTSISQKAAVEAISGDQSLVDKMMGEFQKRSEFIVDAFNQISGVKCFSPEGAFYVFPNVSGIYRISYKGKKNSKFYGIN